MFDSVSEATRFFAIGDVHEAVGALGAVTRSMRRRQGAMAGLLCVGDFGGASGWAEEQSADEYRLARAVLQTAAKAARGLRLPLIFVPGNHDSPQLSARGARNVDLLHKHGPALVGGARVIGVGGAPWLTWLDQDIESTLARAAREHRGTEIVLLHSPPACERGDVDLLGVHAGSPALRHFVDAVGPRVVVCGHLHEAQGVELLGDLVLVNCGLLEGPADPSLPPDPRLAGEDAEFVTVVSYWEVHLGSHQVEVILHRFCPTTHTALASLVWLYEGRRPVREAEAAGAPPELWADGGRD